MYFWYLDMPFEKGWRGGPGRPKKIVEDARQSILAEEFDEAEERKAVRAMMSQARKGNVAAFNALMDRKYGKVPDKVQHSGDPDNPTPVRTVIFHGSRTVEPDTDG